MNLLGKVFKKKKEVKTYPQDGEFKICIINEDTDLMHETLGITNERAEELAKACSESWNEKDKVTDMIQQILGHCKHMNEVTMVFFMFHRIIELKKMEAGRAGMEGMLKELFGK
jgi:hypothetical protein